MKMFSSKFAPFIIEYLEFRMAMGITNESHQRHLELFDGFCAEYYPELEHLNKEVVRGWISYEISQGRTGLLNKVSDIRMFAKYLGAGAYLAPTTLAPKKSAYTPYILTDDELAAFFRAVDNTHGSRDPFLRETAVVLWRLLYTCGLRPREGRLIECNDICFETGEILVRKAKRNKERIVVMSDDMLKICKSYRIRRAVVAGQCEYFFVTGEGSPIKAYQLFHLFRHCWAQANPNAPAHLLPNLRQYDLRHRYASAVLQKWLDEGRNLYAMLPYLRAHMGHEWFSDTAYYIHILPENLLCSPGVDWDAIDKTVPEVAVWNN